MAFQVILHAREKFTISVRSALTSSNCLYCTKSSLKIYKAFNSLDIFSVDDVCWGFANNTHNWLAEKAIKLAQDNRVNVSSNEHKQIRINKDALRPKMK